MIRYPQSFNATGSTIVVNSQSVASSSFIMVVYIRSNCPSTEE